MKIFTAAQIKACDAFTIEEQKISSWQLMERAATKCLDWLRTQYQSHTPFLIICGTGNNGGDGLALTRLLLQEGYSAKAAVVNHNNRISTNTSENLQLLQQLAPDNVQMLEEGMLITELPEDIIIIDALLGTGINKALDRWLFDFVKELNELPNTKIAIDTPSGLPADGLPEADVAIVRATVTLSFQYMKRSFLHPEAAPYIGTVTVLDIGLSNKFTEDTHSQYLGIDHVTACSLYQKRNAFAHKGNMGHALLIGGSYGKSGAICLSAHAALRSGAGLLSVLAPACAHQGLLQSLPEAMFIDGGNKHINQIPIEPTKENYKAIGVGPGLDTLPDTKDTIIPLIKNSTAPLVLDADALNILAEQDESVWHLPANTLLTPHPKEFERLFGKTNNSMLQVELGRAKAMKHNVIIVLKGKHTAVLLPNGTCWYNMSGNAGMATAGSGDVLTGIITSLLAQGYAPPIAAKLGVYLHGKAADIAVEKLGQEALIASDIIKHLGAAYLSLNVYST